VGTGAVGSTPARLTFVGHSTVLIELDGVRVLTDPLLRTRVGPLRRAGPRPPETASRDIDAVLISHSHWDHLDPRSLRRLDTATTLFVPAGAAEALRRHGFGSVVELSPGETGMVGPLGVAATQARHRGFGPPLGPTAHAIGFVIQGSRRIYFAGDTGLFPAMAELGGTLDVALLPVWGWGPTVRGSHLDPDSAAEALRLLRPRVAVPIHWGTYHPIGAGRLRTGTRSGAPHRFAASAARLAPAVDVRILQPDETLELPAPRRDG
jgi:L-ascorbate metabolism protein UlaG (beta-lactamase superfamily)